MKTLVILVVFFTFLSIMRTQIIRILATDNNKLKEKTKDIENKLSLISLITFIILTIIIFYL